MNASNIVVWTKIILQWTKYFVIKILFCNSFNGQEYIVGHYKIPTCFYYYISLSFILLY